MADKLTDPLRYETPADVTQRLDGTYLKYKGHVVKVHYSSGLNVLVVPMIPNDVIPDGGLEVHSSSVHLDISSLRLGFLAGKSKGFPIVCKRRPVRRYKQGVCINNVEFSIFHPDPELVRTHADREGGSLIGRPGFVNMLADVYDTTASCLAYVTAGLAALPTTGMCISAAISRDFAFTVVEGKPSAIILIDTNFEVVGQWDATLGRVRVNDWWATPTLIDILLHQGVSLVTTGEEHA